MSSLFHTAFPWSFSTKMLEKRLRLRSDSSKPERCFDTPNATAASTVDSSKKPVTMTVTVSQSRSAQQRQPKTRNCHFPTVFGSTKATGFNKETPCQNRMSQVQILSARQKARNSNDFNTLDSGLPRPRTQWDIMTVSPRHVQSSSSCPRNSLIAADA